METSDQRRLNARTAESHVVLTEKICFASVCMVLSLRMSDETLYLVFRLCNASFQLHPGICCYLGHVQHLCLHVMENYKVIKGELCWLENTL